MKSIVTKLAAIAALPLALAMSANAVADSHGNKGIMIDDPYVRAVPPGQMNTGVFMKIMNHSDQVRTIVSAESNASKIVELHTHVNDGGVMKMRQIPEIQVPANGHTLLKPGGLHVMLIGLNQPIEVDKPVEVTLVFKNGERKTLQAPGRKLKMKMMHHKGMSHGGMKQGAMKNNMHQMMKHANPMPNLMKVVKQHGDMLELTDEQSKMLAAWRKANHEPMHAKVKELHDIEQAMFDASISGKTIEEIMVLASKAMELRKEIIAGKTACRDNMAAVLSKEQFAQVLSLYNNK